MPRIDLPEIADQAWCPAWMRDAMTGYLQAVIELSRPYDVAADAVKDLLRETRSDEIVDLASGAGGPWLQLFETLRRDRPRLALTLTDLSPNDQAVGRLTSVEGITYLPERVSALDPPDRGAGVRTMFTALHHFDRDQVRDILRAAQRDRVGFAAYEATHRSPRGVLVTLFIPLLVLLLMPRVRPRRLVPLVLTYLPPLLPLLIWWDGLASTLRTYTADELRALTSEIEAADYQWRVEELSVPGGPIPVLQLVGRPLGASSEPEPEA